MSYEITVIQGAGLVAKDRNMFGKKKYSDPYVEVWANGRKVGKTPTIKKTVDPVYTVGNTFHVEFRGDHVDIAFKIWDEDKLSSPDAMGTIGIRLSGVHNYYPQPHTAWWDVPPDSAKKASGKLQLRLHSKKFVTINGIRQLNPVYKKWREAQGEKF